MSKWLKIMVSLLLIVMMAAPAQVFALESVTARLPFTVQCAEGTVVMEPLNGAPAPATAQFSRVEEGTFEITFTKPGNFTYKVYQQPGTKTNVDYDDTVYSIVATVLIGADDKLSATITAAYENDDDDGGEDAEKPKPSTIAFENVLHTGGLSLKKTVDGTAGEKDREWHFTITLSEKVDAVYSGVQFTAGVGHVTLKHSDTVTIAGIPAGTTYEVTEDEANKDDYTTTSTGANGTIEKDKVAEAAFVNKKDAVPPTDPSASNPPTDTNPPVTDPPTDTNPPVTDPPTDTNPPVTDPPVDTTEPTDLPPTEPAATDDSTNPPTTEPNDTDDPAEPPTTQPTDTLEPTESPATTAPTASATPSPTSDGPGTATTEPSPTEMPVNPPPKTGDESNLLLWIGVAGFSLTAIVLILIIGRRRRSKDEEDS